MIEITVNKEVVSACNEADCIDVSTKDSLIYDPMQFEFYHKRWNMFYFRNHYGKFTVEVTDNESLDALNKLKYGVYVKAEFNC